MSSVPGILVLFCSVCAQSLLRNHPINSPCVPYNAVIVHCTYTRTLKTNSTLIVHCPGNHNVLYLLIDSTTILPSSLLPVAMCNKIQSKFFFFT